MAATSDTKAEDYKEQSCENCFTKAENTTEKQLFQCAHTGCRKQWNFLCLICGLTSHKNKRVFDHEFGGSDSVQLQKQYSKSVNQYQTTTSNTNNATKKAVTLSAFSAVVVYEQVLAYGIEQGLKGFTEDAWILTKLGKSDVCNIQLLLCVWECGCELKRYHDDITTGKECIRLITRSITANSVAYGGALSGASIGGAMGGLPGLVAGAIVGGIVADLAARYVFDKIWDDEDKNGKYKEINDALQMFFVNVTLSNVMEKDEFNRDNLQKEYYQAALNAHPDRATGSNEKFADVLKNYNILLGVLKNKEKGNVKINYSAKKVL